LELANRYVMEAQQVRHSLYTQEEKIRHYKSLLARMRAELGKQRFDEAAAAYNKIVAMMRITH